jgi:hypothetical protein
MTDLEKAARLALDALKDTITIPAYHGHPKQEAAALALEAALAQQAEPAVERAVMPAIGDYVLATKYSDGDPGDAWALGFYAGELDMGITRHDIKVAPRYIVNDSSGATIRGNGYRRVARVRKDVGAWLLNVAAKQLEQSPPGTVNIWTMLTDAAFDLGSEQQAEPVTEPTFSVRTGCKVCGVGDGGKAMGYVCPRGDCPTKVTCGGAV